MARRGACIARRGSVEYPHQAIARRYLTSTVLGVTWYLPLTPTEDAMQSTEGTARRAERMRAAYIAATGRPSPFAPETPSLPEWVKRAQENRLPARVAVR